MKKLIFSLVAIMPLACLAITVYDIKYNFSNNSTVTYEAFLVRYDQNGGFIRVKFIDSRNNTVSLVNMNFTEEYREDKLYLVFKGDNPTYLRGSGQYNPDYFWFKKNDNDGMYYSFGVNSPSGDGKFVDGTILSMSLLDLGVLSRDFVVNFFDSNEPFYKNMFAEMPALASNFTVTPRLHLILAASTKDLSIGYSCQYSKSKETEYFRYIASITGMTFSPTFIDGDYFNKSNILAAIDNLKPGKNDVVVFYYNGHGYRYATDTDPYPRLDLRVGRMELNDNTSIPLSYIYNKIKIKNARLSIVVGDCCNSSEPPQTAFGGAVTASSANALSATNCKQLFLFSKGNIIATAATKGQYSLYDPTPGTGGIFSTALLNSLDYHLSTFSANPTWNNVLSEAKNQTSITSASSRCPVKDCRHVPVFKIEDQPVNFTNNFIKLNTTTSATISKIWAEYDVTESNILGMRIHIKFTINNYKGKTGYCSAYFYTSDGTPLKDINNSYNSANGNVAAGKTFVPLYESTVFNDHSFFIPYAELHRKKGYYDLKLNVVINSSNGSKFNSLATSLWHYFTFTQNY